MNQDLKNESVISAFRKTMRNIDWLRTRSLSWRNRLVRFPFRTMQYALIDRFFKILIALKLHGSLVAARTFWGVPLKVTFPDYRCIYHHGLIDGRELPVENYVVEFLEEGAVCLDVGANVGFYTILFSALVGETGKVFAFEPTPRTFKILTGNTKDMQNIIRVNMALMEREGERNLIDYGVQKSGLNLIPLNAQNAQKGDMLAVQASTIDGYCREHNVHPTFIKIDTEGAEEMVLRGATQTLREDRPVLVVEVQRNSPHAVVELLIGLGYDAYQFHDLVAVPYAPADTIVCPNLLFMPTKKNYESN